jgi:hypothetical protein
MKAVSNIFRLQTLRLSQLSLCRFQLFMQQGLSLLQGMFNGFGFIGQTTFGNFVGKTNA